MANLPLYCNESWNGLMQKCLIYSWQKIGKKSL